MAFSFLFFSGIIALRAITFDRFWYIIYLFGRFFLPFFVGSSNAINLFVINGRRYYIVLSIRVVSLLRDNYIRFFFLSCDSRSYFLAREGPYGIRWNKKINSCFMRCQLLTFTLRRVWHEFRVSANIESVDNSVLQSFFEKASPVNTWILQFVNLQKAVHFKKDLFFFFFVLFQLFLHSFHRRRQSAFIDARKSNLLTSLFVYLHFLSLLVLFFEVINWLGINRTQIYF